jgi:hypothetical protein
MIVGNGGGPYKTLKGAVNIHDADVHNIPFNEFFHRHTGTSTTLAAAVSAGDTSITVASATGIVDGTSLQIENGVIETTFPVVTDVVGNVLTLDRPIDYGFEIGDGVEVISTNAALIAGSLAAPISYKIIPDTDQVWHVKSISVGLVHSTTADDSLFGDIAALSNGVVFRAYNATAGQYRTFTNWKANGDVGFDFGLVEYTDKAGGGKFGTKSTASIKDRAGATPRIDGAAGDFLEVLIQDNLTGLTSVRFKAQGHLEGV